MACLADLVDRFLYFFPPRPRFFLGIIQLSTMVLSQQALAFLLSLGVAAAATVTVAYTAYSKYGGRSSPVASKGVK